MPGKNGKNNKKGKPPVSAASARKSVRSRNIRRESGVERLETVLHRDNEPREFCLSWIDAFRRLNRLASVASMYEKYRFTKLKIRYCPSVGTQTNGSLHMAYELDPLDYMNDKLAAQIPSSLSQHPVSLITPVWMEDCLDVDYRDPGEDKYPWKWVDPVQNPRLCSLGKIYYFSDNTELATNMVIGYFELDYTVEFCHPTANPRRVFGSSVTTERGTELVLESSNQLSAIRLDSPITVGDASPRFVESDLTTSEDILDSTSLYTAILGAGAHFFLSGDLGGALLEGTRIYFRGSSFAVTNSTVDNSDLTGNYGGYHSLGMASLTPDMSLPLSWNGRTTSDTTRFTEVERLMLTTHGHDEL